MAAPAPAAARTRGRPVAHGSISTRRPADRPGACRRSCRLGSAPRRTTETAAVDDEHTLRGMGTFALNSFVDLVMGPGSCAAVPPRACGNKSLLSQLVS